MSEAGGPMSCALNLEMREVEKALRVANAAMIQNGWKPKARWQKCKSGSVACCLR